MSTQRRYAYLVDGKQFRVTIDRCEAIRRYQLSLIDNGTFLDMGPPLQFKEFEETYGFKAEWPHEIIGKTPNNIQVRYG